MSSSEKSKGKAESSGQGGITDDSHQPFDTELSLLSQYAMAGTLIARNQGDVYPAPQHRSSGRHSVGRMDELQALQSAFNEHSCVAIIGVGGVGKSTIAAIYSQSHRYNIRYWRNLHHNRSFTDFVQSALDGLGISFDPHDMPLPTEQAHHLVNILHSLRARYLLVLDNFESVMVEDEPEPGWAELLELAISGLGKNHLLLTSRVLPVVHGRNPYRFALSGLTTADGVDLLNQRGVIAEPTMLVNAVERAGGHPLALVFLADLIDNEGYTVDELLTGTVWDGQIAKRLLDKIYQHLSPEQAAVLQYFSLLRTPASPAKIAGILSHLASPPKGWSQSKVRRWASSLMARSLLEKKGGQYQPHPIVRDYAYHLLSNKADYHHGAAEYFRGLYKLNPKSNPPRHVSDVKPLLDAFDQFCAAADYQEAAVILDGTPLEYMSGGGEVTLYELLYRWGEYGHLITMSGHLVNAPTGGLLLNTRGVVLNNMGTAYRAFGKFEKAIAYHTQALTISEQVNDLRIKDYSLGGLGNAYRKLGKYDTAIEHHLQALAIAEQIVDLPVKAYSLSNLGSAYRGLGQYERAIGYYLSALSIFEVIGDLRGKGYQLSNLGSSYRAQGQYERAIGYHHLAFTIFRQIGDPQGEGYSLSGLGTAYRRVGEYEHAIQYHKQALAIFERIGDLKGEGADLGNMGNAYFSIGDYERAIEQYEKALVISEGIGDLKGRSTQLGDLGNAYREMKKYDEAIGHQQHALAIARQIGDLDSQATQWNNLGLSYQLQEQYLEALACYLKALPIRNDIGNPDDMEQTSRHIQDIQVILTPSDWSEIYSKAEIYARDPLWRPWNESWN